VIGKPRCPWLAALLTILFSIGLGHMYSGRLKRGIILFAIGQLLFLTSVISLTVMIPKASYMLLIIFINVAFFVFCVVDAAIAAKSGKENYQPAKYNRWYAYIGYIVIAGLLAEVWLPGIVVTNYVQAFKIPTGGMEPTLLIGDRLLANKRIYKSAEPRRGDVMVFKYPKDPEMLYVKRLIGLPGDTIEVKERTVYVNNLPLEEEYTQYINPGSVTEHYGPWYIPKKGDKIEVAGSAFKLNGEVLNEEIIETYAEHADLNEEPYSVPQDHYFFLGDNRDNSMDSRFWGAVPHDYLSGKALIIYWSFEIPRDEYLRSGIFDRMKQFVDRLLHFGSRTRWNRVLMAIE
jgi:signal peptidase I